MILYDVL